MAEIPIAERQSADLVGPAWIDFPIGEANGIDYTAAGIGAILLRVQSVGPTGALGAVWATDAAPTATLEILPETLTPTSFVARHVFGASPELPYVAPVVGPRGAPSHYTFRYTFFSVDGVRLFLPATCLDLYSLTIC